MDSNDSIKTGLLVSYYLSRCNFEAVKNLGYKTFNDAFDGLGRILNENPHTVKNNRDMFDPYFDNGRVGWYQRSLPPSRKAIMDEFNHYSDEELTMIVKKALKEKEREIGCTDILKDLRVMIRESTIHYNQDFVWQEVLLRDEFKDAYEEYLDKNNWKIEYFEATSVITTPTQKNIFVPNQWFVIASYAVGVYSELHRYKSYFARISEKRREKIDSYAKRLRDSATIKDKDDFIGTGKEVLHGECMQTEMLDKAANRLWRFVNDYSWWSGQKTVDRGDFYLSVVLNMLNLVNASQGYVGDIVNAYGSNNHLKEITSSLEGITRNMQGETYDFIIKTDEPEEIVLERETSLNRGIPTKHRISVSEESIERIGRKLK